MPDFDSVIRVGVVADASELKAQMDSAAASSTVAFQKIADSASVAGNAVVAQAAKFHAQGLSVAESASALKNFGFSSAEVTSGLKLMADASQKAENDFDWLLKSAATRQSALAQIALDAENANAALASTPDLAARVEQAMGKMSSATGAARVEMGLAEGSTGMMASGLARVAAQSATLAPLITAAFPVFAAFAFLDILSQIETGLEKASDDAVGLTAAVKRAEEEDIKFSEHAEEHSFTLAEAHRKLQAAVTESGDIAQKNFNQKWVEAMTNATHATNAFYAGLSDPLVPLTALFNAEEADANRLTENRKVYQGAAKDTNELTAETDKYKLKLVELNEAVAAAGNETGPAGRVQSLKAEITELGDKLRIEQEIAKQELAAKGAGVDAQAVAVGRLAEESKLRGIALTKDLAEAESEAGKKAEKEREEQYAEAIKIAGKYKDSLEAIRALETTPLKVDQSTLKLTTFSSTEAEAMVAKMGAAALDIANKNAAIATEETEMYRVEEDKRNTKTVETLAKQLEEHRKYLDEVAKESQSATLADIALQAATASENSKIAEAQVSLSIGTAEEKSRQVIAIQRTELEEQKSIEAEKLTAEIDYQNKLKEALLAGRTLEQFSTPGGASAEEIDQYRAINAQIEALQQEHALKMQQIDSQIALNAIKDDQQIAASAQRTANVIGQSFDSAFGELLTKHQTFSATMQKFWNDMVIGWAKMGLQIVGTYVQQLAQIVLQNVLNEAKITTIQMGGLTTRKAAATAEDNFLAMLGIKRVTQTGVTEAAQTSAVAANVVTQQGVVATGEAVKTGAVVTAQAAQTTAVVAGTTTQAAVEHTANAISVLGRAKSAAAGAYSAMAAIPVIGPALGAAAAAVTFAAVMAFGAFEKGGVAPEDMLAQLHPQEMVLPADIATPLRAALKPQAASGTPGASPFGPLQIMVPDVAVRGSVGLPGAAGAAGAAGGTAAGIGGQGGIGGPGGASTPGGDTHNHFQIRTEIHNNGSDNSKMTEDSIAKIFKRAQRMGKV